MVLASVSGSVYTSAKLIKKHELSFTVYTLYVALIIYSHVYLFIVHIYTQLRMVAQKAL